MKKIIVFIVSFHSIVMSYGQHTKILTTVSKMDTLFINGDTDSFHIINNAKKVKYYFIYEDTGKFYKKINIENGFIYSKDFPLGISFVSLNDKKIKPLKTKIYKAK